MKNTFIGRTKRFILPSMLLFLFLGLNMWASGMFDVFEVWIKGLPIYTEQQESSVWVTGLVVFLNMFTGMVYTLTHILNTKKRDLGIEESYVGGRKDSDELKSEELKTEELKSEELYPTEEYLSVKDAVLYAINHGAGDNGFRYLWMSSVVTIVMSVIWALIGTFILTSYEEGILENASVSFVVYMVFSIIRLLITHTLKMGILAYTTRAVGEGGNFFKALQFTVSRFFTLLWLELVYYVSSLLIITNPSALGLKDKKWGDMVINFESESLYR